LQNPQYTSYSSNQKIKRDFYDTSVRFSAHKLTGVLVGQPESADAGPADRRGLT